MFSQYRFKTQCSIFSFFLLTFPFYEHERDLVGLAMDAVLGGEEDKEMEADDEDAEKKC